MMPEIPPESATRLIAFNNWLQDIYGENILLDNILIRLGVSDEQINDLKIQYLAPYLDTVVTYLRQLEDGFDESRRRRVIELIIRHYGLSTGHQENFYSIAADYGVNGERIRQLVTKRLELFKTQDEKAALEEELVTITHHLLDY